MDKKIEDFEDLELAEAQGNMFVQLMQIQANLQVVGAEIQKRKVEPEVKKKDAKVETS